MSTRTHESTGACPPRVSRPASHGRSVIVTTLLLIVALLPLAIWSDEILVLSLAGLVPFYVDWKAGDLD